MLDTTQDAVRAMLKADPSLTPADRGRILATLRNHGKADPEPTATEPRIIRRREAARRLGCSLRAVDNWTRAGILRKVRLPGRIRHCGFRESDIAALIAGEGASR
jgi:predicted DNA-binding transcriptional regulator AlpA